MSNGDRTTQLSGDLSPAHPVADAVAQAPSPLGPGLPNIDIHEYGGKKDGERQKLDRRMYMQLRVFDAPAKTNPQVYAKALQKALSAAKIQSVIYEDANSVRGIGLLTWSEDPAEFVEKVRPVFAEGVLADLDERLDYNMLGRTYSTGHEPDLEHVLLRRSVNNVQNDHYGWHVWYPLRRNGQFAVLDGHEQSIIMREHASIGMAYGQNEFAHDIRLACHGLDARDNEFVIGIVSSNLHRLSHLVQTMRKTRQTSEFITQMGPFFVGRVFGRSVA
jgi:Chlorite dismutase